jgi:hypothetical protein
LLAGSPLSLSVIATGTAPLSCQWKRNGVVIGGATGPVLTVANAQATQAGAYTVSVSNVCTTVESLAATVTIGEPPVITDNPRPLTVQVGVSATFSVTVTGDGPCTYQWTRDGVVIPGATAAVLTIAAAQLSDEADYAVGVTCPFGFVNSAAARLTVVEAPRIVFDPISEVVLAGTNAVISADAVGTEPLTYQWYYEGVSSGRNAGTPVVNATGATLVFQDVEDSRTGSYYCIASNPYGSAVSRAASITVLAPPDIDVPASLAGGELRRGGRVYQRCFWHGGSLFSVVLQRSAGGGCHQRLAGTDRHPDFAGGRLLPPRHQPARVGDVHAGAAHGGRGFGADAADDRDPDGAIGSFDRAVHHPGWSDGRADHGHSD